MQAEVKRRVDILEYMRKTGVTSHRDVAKIVSSYYKNPKVVMEEIRNVLYEGGVPTLFVKLQPVAVQPQIPSQQFQQVQTQV